MIVKERYNIILNPTIVSKIDNYCSRCNISRSSFINSILLDFILSHDLLKSDVLISDDEMKALEEVT